MDFLLRNATIVNENDIFVANVVISQGIIQKIDKTLKQTCPTGFKEINLSGLYLLPGIIDTHVHFREPGNTNKACIKTESRAAVAGGVTSYLDMPNNTPQIVKNELLETKYKIAEKDSVANFGFYLGATNDNIDEIKNMDVKNVPGVKLFMGSSTGNMFVDDDNALNEIFEFSPTIVAVHAEDENIIRQNKAYFANYFKDKLPDNIHELIRNEAACYNSTKKAINLACAHDARLHVLHLSTAKELNLFAKGNVENKKITAEVCVNHLWFDDGDYSLLKNLIKCNPAIKGEYDKLSLRNALNNSIIDVVSTDHAPHTYDEKNSAYHLAPSGIPSVQHSLQIMLEMVKRNVFKLQNIPLWMSHNPAKCFKIENRGFIREGYFADLVVVDLNKPKKIERGGYFYRCGWSPYDGFTFSSDICYTFVNSNLVYDGNKVYDDVCGSRLTFDNQIY